MAIPSHHQPENVLLSVFRAFKERFQDLYPEYGVDYDDELFDADGQDLAEPRARWVRLTALDMGTGQKTGLLLQVDCMGRVGTAEERTTDRHGFALATMVQRVRAAFMARSFPVYDYAGAADRRDPAATGHCCFVRTAAGVLRAAESYARLPTEDGVMRRVLTYRIWTAFDVAAGHVYDHQ